jgi:hypothetical protein
MKSRDDMTAVIKGLQKKQSLLAAFLEATYRRDLQEHLPIINSPKPATAAPHQSPQALT